jgi:ectoine hydroxylase-related dioxygenase (phytanoyl-CoA dioxygenase family)
VVTSAQRREFEERGWFDLGPVFGAAALAEIGTEYDRILERALRIGERGKEPFEYSPLLHVQSPILCRHATHPALVGAAVDLLGPDVRLYWDQAVSKPPGATSEVPWHQDNGYTPVVPEQYLTFTVALDAASQENGCLWIQPGSHHAGVRPHEPTDTVFFRGYDGEEPGVAVPQDEGHVLCFSSLTLHRTGPNASERPRRSWVIQFCDAQTRHRESGRLYDDRLLVAQGGRVLEEPVRQRPLDLAEIARAAGKAQRERKAERE